SIIGLNGPKLISNISSGHYSVDIMYSDRFMDRLNVTIDAKHSLADIWSDDLIYDLKINVSSNKWEFDLTPNSSTPLGDYSVRVGVVDPWGAGEFKEFPDKFTIFNVNDPPEIIGTPLKNCMEDAEFIFEPDIFDLDPEDVHSWMIDTDATFLSIDPSTGRISGIPKNSDIGSYTVNIVVRDQGSLTDEMNFSLTVVNVNDPPDILSDFPDHIMEDSFFEFEFKALDIDPTEDILLWEMDTNCSFLVFQRSEGIVRGTPANKDVGSYFISINVTDGNGGFNETLYLFEVLNTNDPPALVDPPTDIEIYEDTSYSIRVLPGWFADEDNDMLDIQYSTPGNLFLTLTDQNILVIRPVANWSGEETISFYASDGEFEVGWNVVIRVLPVNDAPTNISISISKYRFSEDEDLVISGNARDVDLEYGDQLHFSWFDQDGHLLGMGKTLEIDLEAGEYEIILNVTDQKGSGSETSVFIEIFRETTFLETYGLLLILISVIFSIIILVVVGIFVMRRMGRKEQENKDSEDPVEGDNLSMGAAGNGFSATMMSGGQLVKNELPSFMKQPEELPPPGEPFPGPTAQLPPVTSGPVPTPETSEYVRPQHDDASRGGFKAPPSPAEMTSQLPQPLSTSDQEYSSDQADHSNPPSVTSVLDQPMLENSPLSPAFPQMDPPSARPDDINAEFNSPVWSPEMVGSRVASDARSAVEMLHELNQLKTEGAITEEEFQIHKKRLLRKI
ncbi:MAG: Ig-like domain-containing protein, partial [Candidatus Thermoplasmatota archaeon]|nr:Ig-like domain-containing protein [Candidatus Thermoplasmatota archaeon]